MASELRRLVHLDRATQADLARAGLELGIARLRLGSRHARAMIAASVAPTPVAPLDSRQSAHVDRVAFAIPRVAARLPWRADCLVQALAAERWLRSQGIIATLHFGVPRNGIAKFEAHAWLKAGDQIVTGGDIASYVALEQKRA